MKFKVFAILLCSSVILTAGTAVAYYNTKSFGFDEDAKVISFDKKSVTVYDFQIEYDDVKRVADNVYKAVPHTSYRCCI